MLTKRELIGFAVAPLPVVGPLLLMFTVILSSAPPDSGAAFEAAAELVLGSYLATLLIGLPIHLILRWKRRTSLAAHLGSTVVGASLPAGFALAYQALFPRWAGDNPFALTMWSRAGVTATLTFVAVACLCGWIFWAVAVRRRRT